VPPGDVAYQPEVKKFDWLERLVMQHSTTDKRMVQLYQKQDMVRTQKWSMQNPVVAAK
jgi:hypothetical protein